MQVSGKAYGASYAAPTPATLTTAVYDMEAAYTDAANRIRTDDAKLNLNGGLLGGDFGGIDAPLTPGIYTFPVGVTISSNIYFQGTGGDDDIFIIQIAGILTQASGSRVFLLNGALAKNIVWQSSGLMDVGTYAHMEGILMSYTGITFKTHASLNGRIFAQTACVLQMAYINEPSLTTPPSLDQHRSVNTGTAGNYVILAKSGISTVPASIITGNIAVSPITAAAMTGFEDGFTTMELDPSGQFSTSSQVYARNCTYTHVYAHMCTYVHVCVRMCMYVHVCAESVCTRVCVSDMYVQHE